MQHDGRLPRCHLTLKNDLDLEVTLTKIKALRLSAYSWNA